MSHVLSIEVSDHVYEAIQADADASGVTPAEVAASALEKQYANGHAGKLPKTLTLGELESFLKTLPKLGDDADAFARDVESARQEIPMEKNPWA